MRLEIQIECLYHINTLRVIKDAKMAFSRYPLDLKCRFFVQYEVIIWYYRWHYFRLSKSLQFNTTSHFISVPWAIMKIFQIPSSVLVKESWKITNTHLRVCLSLWLVLSIPENSLHFFKKGIDFTAQSLKIEAANNTTSHFTLHIQFEPE